MKLLGRLHSWEACVRIPLWQQFILKEDWTLWWNILLTVRNIPLERSKFSFIESNFKLEVPLPGNHILFFWIENIAQDVSCDTRDVLVQYIDYVIKTDIPDESDVELCQSVKRPQTHSIVTVNILKKPTTFICFTNHLIHNQVGYASSEIHDSTQRKEIFPPTKTYCSFNKDFARLLILMQCINKLYLYSTSIENWHRGMICRLRMRTYHLAFKHHYKLAVAISVKTLKEWSSGMSHKWGMCEINLHRVYEYIEKYLIIKIAEKKNIKCNKPICVLSVAVWFH